MAVIESWVRCDLNKPVQVQMLGGNLFSMDNQGNQIGVEVFDNGEAATLGGTVSANVIRADGATVAVSGTLSGNRAYVVLPQAAYAVPGFITIVIKLTSSSVVTTLAAVTGIVYRSSTDTAVDPGTIIPSIETLIAEIEAAVASIPADYSSLWTSLAPAFSTSTDYIRGQFVTYNGYLCRFTADHPAGSWNSSHATTISLGNELLNTIHLLAANNELIPANSNLNDYTTPGNYSIANAQTAGSISNYPFSVGGKIIILQTTSASAVIQLAIANNAGNIKWRIRTNNAWTDWSTVYSEASGAGKLVMGNGLVSSVGLTDLDNAGVNTIYGYSFSDIANLSNFPESVSKGGLIVTLNSSNINAGRIQFVIAWANTFIVAMRCYVNGAWSGWGSNGEGVTTIHCGVGQTYTNLVDVLDYVTSDDLRNTWNETNRLVIQLDEGEYKMDKIATLYTQDQTRYEWGVYIPRCCTIKGAGKDKTFITYDYSGSDDWILGHLSPINMPYESTMQDLTITAKNCRYCVHSDGDAPFNRVWAKSNMKITVRNVRMIHHGYSAGNNPTYNVPSAWGAGVRDNVVCEFTNCEFIAKHMPWFTHDTVGNTVPCEITFRNCRFINNKNASFDSTGEYGGPTFISWGTDVISNVSFFDCYSNRYICLRLTKVYNENTTCDYFIYDDGKNMIVEDTVNDAYLLDTWINRNCITATAGQNLNGYVPVSVNVDGFASAYTTGTFRHGIAINSCSADDPVTVQYKGLIDLRKIGVTGFSPGTKVGYSSGSWVEDNVNPILVIVSSFVGEII